jgi:hypothetical protein
VPTEQHRKVLDRLFLHCDGRTHSPERSTSPCE